MKLAQIGIIASSGGGEESNWILATSDWLDDGIWDDDAVWID